VGRFFPHPSRPALGSIQPPVQWVRGLSRGKERPGRDADLSPLLVPWSRKSRIIPLLSLWAVRPVQSLSVCTMVHFTFYSLHDHNCTLSDTSRSALQNHTRLVTFDFFAPVCLPVILKSTGPEAVFFYKLKTQMLKTPLSFIGSFERSIEGQIFSAFFSFISNFLS